MRRLIPGMAACLIGCSAAPPSSEPVVVAQVDTIISSESAGIAFAIDVEVDSAGTLFVADYQANQVLRIDPATGAITPIGRKGEGPGEFDQPWAIRPTAQELLVVDRGNGRMQYLSHGGEYDRSHPVSHMIMRGLPYVLPDGRLVIGSNGRDSSLVLVYDSTVSARRVGVPIVEPPEIADFTAIKAAIADGVVPADLRNEVLTAANDQGDVWVALQTEAEVRRYDASGALAWTSTITEPELTASREAFFQRNADEANGAVFYSLRYFSDLALVGDRLWVLLATQDDGVAVVLVLDDDGSVIRRIEVAGGGGATSMAIDPVRSMMYLYTSQDAQLLSAAIPSM